MKIPSTSQEDQHTEQRPPLRRLFEHYLLAIAVTGLAGAGREALVPLIGRRFPFTTFYVAVVASSWIGGLGPGLCSTALGALAAFYFWGGSAWSFRSEEPRDLIGACPNQLPHIFGL